MGTRCADHVTPLYPQKLALTLPTGGSRSVGIVRVRTKATEFSLWDHRCIWGPSLTETSLCGVYLHISPGATRALTEGRTNEHT